MKPNILLLMTDQQRADALGCVTPWMDTPHMDRIAAEGVRFSRCVTNSPVCIPARRSLATGHYPHNTGIWRNQETTLDPEAPNWMRAVREAGYRTSLFGKTHLNHAGDDLRERAHLLTAQGIDDVYETVGPRQCARTLSHMTAEWQSLGIWDAYRRDFAERFASKPHLVRPSPAGLRTLLRHPRRPEGKGLPGGLRSRSALVLLGQLRRPPRALGYARTLVLALRSRTDAARLEWRSARRRPAPGPT